ncbi:hypothetical protein BCR42DRAFT_493988 [Absidia repens]|uniref:F-box domain-containing protein n=1 Tax=Absidia repens TaxID=90262 RepID=A0A1X2I829_9FUNG|nr:hypothetical protein BCR42DRAFT_493988 [Absidia repens]
MVQIAHLPTEIIARILHHVTSRRDLFTCALVNQWFYQTTTPILWRSLTFTSDEALVAFASTTLAHHPSLGHHVHHLQSGTYPNGITFDDIVRIKTNHALTDSAFQHLIHVCPHLTSVRLENCGITQASLAVLIHHTGPRLRCLVLKSCPHLCPDVYLPMLLPVTTNDAGGCPVLDTLEISAATTSWTNRALTALHQLSHLTRFAIDGAPSSFLRQLLLNDNVWAPRLTCLHIDNGYDLGDDDLLPFLKTHRLLQDIRLPAGQYTDATLDAMRLCLPALRRVDLSFTYAITRRGVRALVMGCPRLTFMDLFSCCGVEADQFPEAHGECLMNGGGGGGGASGFAAYDAELLHLDEQTMHRIRLSKHQDDIGLHGLAVV